MFRATLLVLLCPTLLYAADQRASVAWVWATTIPEPKLKTDAAWLWAHLDDEVACAAEIKCESQKDIYTAMIAKAQKGQQPIVVGVGCEPTHVEGHLSCRWDGFPGVKGPAIVVGVPDHGNMYQSTPLPCKSTAEQIRAVSRPKPIQAPPPQVVSH